MIDEQKLRAKLADLWKRKLPIKPASFAEAEVLINEVIEASTVSKLEAAAKKVKKVVGKGRQ